ARSPASTPRTCVSTGRSGRRAAGDAGSCLSGMIQLLIERSQYPAGCLRDDCTGAKYRSGSVLMQKIVILGRDDAADHDHDVAAPLLRQFINQLRQQCFVAAGQRTDANDMHVVFDSLPGDFLRCLEQGADVHIKAEIGKGGSNYLRAPVMAVLPDFGDQNTRPAAFDLGKGIAQAAYIGNSIVLAELGAVNSGNRAGVRLMAAPRLFQRVGYFAQGSTDACRLDSMF